MAPRELTVPDDFRFTVDGKPMSVHDLKAGMKGTATVTTTTTFRPVYVTEIKKGTVVRQVGTSVHVRTDEGIRWFKKAEIDARGIKIIMDGKPIRVTDLKEGDQLTAMIVTPAPPEVITEKDVQASLDAAEAEAPRGRCSTRRSLPLKHPLRRGRGCGRDQPPPTPRRPRLRRRLRRRLKPRRPRSPRIDG